MNRDGKAFKTRVKSLGDLVTVVAIVNCVMNLCVELCNERVWNTYTGQYLSLIT